MRGNFLEAMFDHPTTRPVSLLHLLLIQAILYCSRNSCQDVRPSLRRACPYLGKDRPRRYERLPMPKSSRLTPRRAARQRPRHLIVYATAVVMGLALGSTLVVLVMPRKKAIAQTIPVIAPHASPDTPPVRQTPVSVPTPAVAVSHQRRSHRPANSNESDH